MKKDTHPEYNPEAEVICACGNKFKIGSTQKKIEVEICSACHPFYTGNEKIMDTAGRVDKFKKRMAAKTGKAKVKKTTKTPKKTEVTEK
ncbi:50S ribosomal protein L31 [Patescibacteria group bacterium]|nr:50S ribosomal protein L31 [Patescibacteria group bacterium]MCG2695061.1 50S ribosomal protein L31 [Candidatus Parcubacteria bacterium]